MILFIFNTVTFQPVRFLSVVDQIFLTRGEFSNSFQVLRFQLDSVDDALQSFRFNIFYKINGSFQLDSVDDALESFRFHIFYQTNGFG